MPVQKSIYFNIIKRPLIGNDSLDIAPERIANLPDRIGQSIPGDSNRTDTDAIP